MRVETEVVINRTTDEVLGFIVDVAGSTMWSENTVEAIQTSNGPVTIGSTCKIVTRAMDRIITHEFEVTDYCPGKQYTVHSISGPFHVTMSYITQEVPEGTRLRAVSEVELVGPMALLGTVMSERIQKQFDSDHSNLKRLLESPSNV